MEQGEWTTGPWYDVEMAEQRSSKSPFPGMDPYLQSHWSGVHTRLIAYAADAIQPQLPGDLVARVEENVRLDVDDEMIALRSPDVYVSETGASWSEGAKAGAGPVEGPVVLEIAHDPLIDRHIEIREGDGGRVVTAIEFLSPWNKAEGVGRDEYMKKREQYLHSHANLVEIDLIRGGKWYQMIPPYRVPKKYRTTYRVTVKRAAETRKLELYPIGLAQVLPTVRVPLRVGEADVVLNVQELIDQVYRNGAFGRTDYSKACEPPLEGEEIAVAARFLHG